MEIPALYELLRKRCRVLILKGLEKTKKNQFLYIFVKSFRSAFFLEFLHCVLNQEAWYRTVNAVAERMLILSPQTGSVSLPSGFSKRWN